jgi:hypothetical protein
LKHHFFLPIAAFIRHDVSCPVQRSLGNYK